MTGVILLGALGYAALWPSSLPEVATPDSSTLTAYLSELPPATVLPAVTGAAVPATVAGRVWEVYFTEGQHVRQGQLLVKVAQKLVSAEHHRLQQVLGRQQLAQATLAAQQPAAAPELAAAARLVATTERQLAALPTQLSFQFITAPHDGVMLHRSVVSGDYLSVGTAIGHLAPLPAPPTDDSTLLLSSIY